MPDWGRSIGEKCVDTYKIKIYEPRPHSMLAFLQEAQKFGTREFIVFAGRRISFQRFIAATGRAANRLEALGVVPGEVVLLNAANSPEFLLLEWGLLRAGAVVAQANAWWTATEFGDAVELVGARLVIADARRRSLVESDPRLRQATVIALEDYADCFDGEDAPESIVFPDRDEEAAAVLIFTSGTTGKPKAAMMSHRAIVAVMHNIYLYRGRTPDEIGSDEPLLSTFCCTPLFHVGGILAQAQALLGGRRLVILDGRAEGGRMLEIIERERINIWGAVPTLLSRVLDHPDAATRDLSSVVAISSSGSMVNPALIVRARSIFPSAKAGASSTYGMTESGGSVTMIDGQDYVHRPTSAGRAFPTCEVRIDQPDAEGTGEILMRTPSAMTGYWGRSDSLLDAEGWIHSGDLGRLDAEGYLYVTGRSKDVIIRGGENLAASVVEDRLNEHPTVAEAAVVGLPHDQLGEEVGAVVVLRPGTAATAEELAAFVGAALSYFQVPTRWWIRGEPLSTNAVGKIVKPELIASWAERETKAVSS